MTNDKKRIVILFPYPWFPQAPTILGLYDYLKEKAEVKILTLYNPKRGSILDNPDFIYLNQYKTRQKEWFEVKRSYFAYQLLKLKRIIWRKAERKYKILNTDWLLYGHAIKKYLKQFPADEIIAVDPAPAFLCQRWGKSYHFLSTELQTERLMEMKDLDIASIRSVIIQNEQRFNLLTIEGVKQLNHVFYIQNAPVFKMPEKRTVPSNRLIFAGGLWDGFGFKHCLALIRKYKKYTLTLKGTPLSDIEACKQEYAEEIKEGRLVIDTAYASKSDFDELLQDHSIGFSFYDTGHPEISKSKEHYLTAPSGKMFTYFGLGIPVIGSFGLKEIDSFEAGITLQDFSPDSLNAAIETILADYSTYSANALKASSYYSFDKLVKPFADFILD